MAKFYEWENQEAFDLWHKQIMASKNIPDEITFAYTLSQQIGLKVIATVEDQDAEGLTETDLRPSLPDDAIGYE